MHQEKRTSAFTVVAFGLVTLLLLSAASQPVDQLMSPSVSMMASPDPAKWTLAQRQAIHEKEVATQVLKAIITQPVSPENRAKIAEAIKMAGTIRDTDLIPAILDKIDFSADPFPAASRPADPVTDYVAVQALIAIGNTAVNPALHELGVERERGRKILLAAVVANVLGKDCAKHSFEAEASNIREAGGDPTQFDVAIQFANIMQP
jgi:hypothetical protein